MPASEPSPALIDTARALEATNVFAGYPLGPCGPYSRKSRRWRDRAALEIRWRPRPRDRDGGRRKFCPSRGRWRDRDALFRGVPRSCRNTAPCSRPTRPDRARNRGVAGISSGLTYTKRDTFAQERKADTDPPPRRAGEGFARTVEMKREVCPRLFGSDEFGFGGRPSQCSSTRRQTKDNSYAELVYQPRLYGKPRISTPSRLASE